MKKKMFIAGMTALLLCACGADNNTVSGNASDNTAVAAGGAGESAENAAGEGGGGAAGGATAQDGTTLIAGVSASSLNTGNLSESGSGYEGTEGTGAYNYGEALQKSLLFYELQRSGALPEEVRCNWRGDSALNDGADSGVDLSGGWYDAGDHVKFNLPMAYTGAMLAWSLYEDRAAYEESGQLEYMLSDLRWVNDYLMKCHASDGVYYYQVGDGGSDHSWWGPAEVLPMERPSYKVTKDQPGSAVVAEAAASLAAASCVLDGDYAAECLKHARELYDMADTWRSDSGYTQANGFYDSHSGFYDELAWSSAWLYLATGEDKYLEAAKKDYGAKQWDYNWSLCWDDVHIGAAALLAEAGAGKTYTDAIEKHLDYWTTGTDGQRITYTPKGLAWLDGWGPLRYATTTAFVAAVYSRGENCPASKKDTYWDFAVSQADYALGSSGHSYVCGFGENPPVHPHHRTSQGSYSNNMNEPATARHTLYGALVGGPDASDNYTDEVSNYQTNEVACDYNAGFTGLLAAMYSVYHGQTLKDFGAVELPGAEFYTEAGVNVDGDDFIEVKAYVYDVSAWPARAASDLELRYFVDLSEVYEAGGTAGNIEISNNYMSGGRVDGLKAWDEEKHLYYLSVVFDDGSLYPGGQEHYKKEMQVRLRNSLGVWDDSNDPSYAGIGGSGQVQEAKSVALYEDGVLIWGSEPEGGADAGKSVSEAPGSGKAGNTDNAAASGNKDADKQTGGDNKPVETKPSAGNGKLSVNVRYDGMGSSATALAGNMEIKNEGAGSIKLKDLKIKYYFTKEGDASLVFDCYHAAVQGAGGAYNGLSKVNGSFSSASGQNADTLCTISFDENTELGDGDTLVVNFSIHLSDWAAMNTSNDWSVADAEHIVFENAGSILFGTAP